MRKLIFRDTNWFICRSNCVFGKNIIFTLTDDQADCFPVSLPANQIIRNGNVRSSLTYVRGGKSLHLHLNYNVAMEP